ncbi:conserved hypothetical protein [Chlorobium ferrooxidans DSM 13031]|uniref:Uncharacterized protein n=2 Tax=Chlorobium/Pelodictyon group TaxID=274493 RepID=Q0YQA5_9CHLB|nr:conserved hypothetical protein [Chlorobium ferrooxidans DSM 13031]
MTSEMNNFSMGSESGSNDIIKGGVIGLRRALAVDTTSANVFIGSAIIKIDSGDCEGAISDLTRAIKLNPESVVAYSGRATARFAEEDLKGALADLVMAEKLKLTESLGLRVL